MGNQITAAYSTGLASQFPGRVRTVTLISTGGTTQLCGAGLSALAKMYLEPLCGRGRMIMAMQPKGQQKSAGSLHQKWLADRRGVED